VGERLDDDARLCASLPPAGDGATHVAGRAPCFSPPRRRRGSEERARIVEIARSWLGTPYLHQASVKGQGADCLGLVRGVWRELYGAEPEIAPPYTPDWNERRHARGEEPLLDAARRNLRAVLRPRAGDVLVFRIVAAGPAKHCGILTEEGRFIHAYAGRCVLESWLSRWWRDRLAGAFAFPILKDSA
jgi:NlpC/P60 family putative phage cell wall peptidase